MLTRWAEEVYRAVRRRVWLSRIRQPGGEGAIPIRVRGRALRQSGSSSSARVKRAGVTPALQNRERPALEEGPGFIAAAKERSFAKDALDGDPRRIAVAGTEHAC